MNDAKWIVRHAIEHGERGFTTKQLRVAIEHALPKAYSAIALSSAIGLIDEVVTDLRAGLYDDSHIGDEQIQRGIERLEAYTSTLRIIAKG